MNIIVNGGSRGIGREVALLFSKDKDNQILVTGRDEKNLNNLSSSAAFNNISCLKLDLTLIENEITVIRDQIFGRFRKVDVLINNAGNLVVKEFMKISDREVRTMMETNFFGPATLIKMLVPIMGEGSHIVNIASMGGFLGSSKYRGLAYYSASKAALACLSECLAVELKDKGISVNCLALGSVHTDMFEKAFPGFSAPLNPASMAEFIVYFALYGYKYFNGKVLPVTLGDPQSTY